MFAITAVRTEWNQTDKQILAALQSAGVNAVAVVYRHGGLGCTVRLASGEEMNVRDGQEFRSAPTADTFTLSYTGRKVTSVGFRDVVAHLTESKACFVTRDRDRQPMPHRYFGR